MLVERVERLVGDGRVDADAQRRVPPAAAACSRRSPAAVRSKVPCTPRALVVQVARAVNRHADVLEEPPARGERRQRVGALVGDDRPVGREVAADV